MTKSEDFDRRFDEGKDVTGDLVISEARRPNYEQKRVNVDFPLWMVEALDREAGRMGVPRQSLIKMLIARHLEEEDEVA